MAIVRPFRGIRYNLENVLLKKVIAPPYDVISEEYKQELISRSNYNVVRIDMPDGENKYQEAAKLYNLWKTTDVLTKDLESKFYVYEQEYDYNGKHYIRTGFVGLLKLEEFGKGVYPHEKTLSGPKQDRMDLMVACKANFSQIFGLYVDPESKLEKIFADSHHQMPVESVIDDDMVKHSVWAVTSSQDQEMIQNLMKDKAIYIADGHHRYETAVNYRNKMRELNGDDPSEVKPYDFVMMMFVNFYDPGLMVFPTHRVVDVPAGFDMSTFVEKLKEDFIVTPIEDGKEEAFINSSHEHATMVVITDSGKYGIFINQERMDSLHPVFRNVDTYLLEKNILFNILHINEEQILQKKGIYFYQTVAEVEKSVAEGNRIGFIMKAMNIDVVRQVAENGLVMPQKSTFFYPKLATGLLLNDLS